MTIYARTRQAGRITSRPAHRAANPTPAFEATAPELAAVIGAWAEKLSANGFPETATLLEIARLDLIARLNGISDEEMQAFAFAAQRQAT